MKLSMKLRSLKSHLWTSQNRLNKHTKPSNPVKITFTHF
jgi:hypothetical protein